MGLGRLPMTTERVERRLTAIASADVVGYSRLMGLDEAGTRAALNSHRQNLIDPKLDEHHGRLVSTAGDSLLVEFRSVVDAVQWAVEVQRGISERNADTPEDRRIVFRIGINLGDVIVEGDDIHGDGVNVAARLQALSEPGGICISRKVFEEARNRVSVGFEDLGEQSVKNIAEPIRTYRVLVETEAAGKVVGRKEARRRLPKRWRWAIPVAAAVVVIGVAAGVLLTLEPWVPRVEAAVEADMAFPLPEKPSIVVLPFENVGGDPQQDHFADGVTGDIITHLSRLPYFFVIDRNTTFAYKGKTPTAKQVAEELGVRYLLGGSVQRSGERLRITTQLIDAVSGRHVWSQRYDREATDLFALQDDITRNVSVALEVELTEGEQAAL
jgi:adenylate cyclase